METHFDKYLPLHSCSFEVGKDDRTKDLEARGTSNHPEPTLPPSSFSVQVVQSPSLAFSSFLFPPFVRSSYISAPDSRMFRSTTGVEYRDESLGYGYQMFEL